MTTVTITLPDKTTPGFARRLHRAALFQERVKEGGFTADLVKDLIEFMADFIEGDRDAAREYLWDCSEFQFNDFLGAVNGGSTEQVPPLKSETTATP